MGARVCRRPSLPRSFVGTRMFLCDLGLELRRVASLCYAGARRRPVLPGGMSDLHVWRVGKNRFACAISVVMHDDTLTPQRLPHQLAVHDEIAHVIVEIQHRAMDATEHQRAVHGTPRVG
jgi:hypothetical protein